MGAAGTVAQGLKRLLCYLDWELIREIAVAVAGLPAGSNSSKVRTGQVGEARRLLGPEVAAELDAVWQKRITPELGFASYADMIAALQTAQQDVK